MTDRLANFIFYISKEKASFNAIFAVTGKPLAFPGESTARNGNLAKATFLNPSSITIYDKNLTRIAEMKSLQPFYLISNISHTWSQRTDCIYGNGLNFTYYDSNIE